jgi:hypothetical protein
MSTLVKGLYSNGRLELLERPVGLREGRVRILLIEEPATASHTQLLEPGKYGVDTSTIEDFKEAEWHGEAEYDN